MWIDHDATRYHNFNALPYALPHALPYIFSQFNIGHNGTPYHNFNALPHVLIFSLSLAWFGGYLQHKWLPRVTDSIMW